MEQKYDITLRPIVLEDAELIVKWRNSDAVKPYFIYQDNFTVCGQKQWIETKVKTGEVVQFIILETESKKPIGTVYLRDVDNVFHKAEYGIFIGEENAKGKGYGTQAAQLMIKYAFETMKLHRLYLRVFADNMRAIFSYQKAGFSQEGLLRDDVYVNGQYRDIVWMSIINEAV